MEISLQVSHKREEEITFRISQQLNVGVLQPAAVSVYEYYDHQHNNRKSIKIISDAHKRITERNRTFNSRLTTEYMSEILVV